MLKQDDFGRRSHPSRVRELKQRTQVFVLLLGASHPSRVRELKREEDTSGAHRGASHPSRVRELKLKNDAPDVRRRYRRTPPGCVN